MEIEQKLAILKKLDTQNLIDKLQKYEDEFEKAITAETDFKSQNQQFLGAGDCREVKRILAELAVQTPEPSEEGKKLTAAGREAWLEKQRTENKELSEAIAKQRQVAFLIDDHQIKCDMAKRRLTSVIAILALKTAQLNFLAI